MFNDNKLILRKKKLLKSYLKYLPLIQRSLVHRDGANISRAIFSELTLCICYLNFLFEPAVRTRQLTKLLNYRLKIMFIMIATLS